MNEIDIDIDIDIRHRIGRARLLRRQGKTYEEIRAVVGPVRDETMAGWLKGIPRPPTTYRTRSLDDLRRRCREMRGAGLTYGEIREITGVGAGTLSMWLRGIPPPPALSDAARRRAEARRVEALRNRAAELNAQRAERRSATVENATGQIGAVSDRELQFWAATVGITADALMRTTLKRHRPATPRRNTGPSYRGCLTIDVVRSAELYRRVEGWWIGLSAGASPPRSTLTSLSFPGGLTA
jgi:hypothetical protein